MRVLSPKRAAPRHATHDLVGCNNDHGSSLTHPTFPWTSGARPPPKMPSLLDGNTQINSAQSAQISGEELVALPLKLAFSAVFCTFEEPKNDAGGMRLRPSNEVERGRRVGERPVGAITSPPAFFGALAAPLAMSPEAFIAFACCIFCMDDLRMGKVYNDACRRGQRWVHACGGG